MHSVEASAHPCRGGGAGTRAVPARRFSDRDASAGNTAEGGGEDARDQARAVGWEANGMAGERREDGVSIGMNVGTAYLGDRQLVIRLVRNGDGRLLADGAGKTFQRMQALLSSLTSSAVESRADYGRQSLSRAVLRQAAAPGSSLARYDSRNRRLWCAPNLHRESHSLLQDREIFWVSHRVTQDH
jgi:hypothetical protein